jgi:exopolyphosphatase/guanosine-5'-triphosphate,3'-diphosphate pyrophosphatase
LHPKNTPLNLGAIDIGSNAVRLLVAQAIPYKNETVDFTKLSLLRLPLRLGLDVFESGLISQEKVALLEKSMESFRLIMEIYGVTHFRACATSAMRDASNSPEIVQSVLKKTGINIEVISGREEAEIIYETHLRQSGAQNGSTLYIDVGGGSTELTLYSFGEKVLQESFDIGTIRLMSGKVKEEIWDEIKRSVKIAVKDHKPLKVVGSGGNINKLFALSKQKEGQPITLSQLETFLRDLGSMTMEERMHTYQLRQERAEVIVPALQIYTSILRWAGAREISVPKIGLADGLVRNIYYNQI